MADYTASTLRPDSSGALADVASAADFFAEASRDPETVRRYVAALARPNGGRKQAPNGCKVSTIMRRLSAIPWAATTAGYADPTKDPRVRDTVKGIRRILRVEPERKKPLTVELVCELVAVLPEALHGRRDRVLILFGIAGGLRRSELVGLAAEHLIREPEGIVAHLRSTKTDQEGLGRDIAIPFGRVLRTRPVRAYDAWVAATGITSGANFSAD